MLTKEEKKEIRQPAEEEKNTGSAEAQVFLLSKQIEKLFAHLKKNRKDVHSKRGLLSMVNKRRKLLNHVKRRDEKRYKEIISKIGLKK